MKIKIILTSEKEGGYTVKIPVLDGCFTQGETIEEAIENAKEAVELYLEDEPFEINESQIVEYVELK